MPTASAAAPQQTRLLHCGCTVAILFTPCSNCLGCPKHCKCARCNGCLDMYHRDELCDICSTCIDQCCGCIPCKTCKRRFPANQARAALCGNCSTCTTCCKCWTCAEKGCGADYRALFINQEERAKHFHIRCHKCENHCKCSVCCVGKAHSVFVGKMCANCGACHDHCKCAVCTRCSRRTTSDGFHATVMYGFTGEVPCNLCNRCCRCNVKGVEMRKGKFSLFNAVFSRGQFKENKLRRHLACELEVDQFSTAIRSSAINQAIDKWGDSVVPDGSVPGGFEINMNPTNGDLFLQHARDLADGLAIIKAGCTVACGMHVHVNVKGTPLIDSNGVPTMNDKGEQAFDSRTAYTHYDLRRLAMLYYKIERAMFELCSPVRLNARYSKICGKFYLTKNGSDPKAFRQQSASKMYNAGAVLPSAGNPASIEITGRNLGVPPKSVFKQIGAQIKHNKSHKYQPVRYNALNLHSFFLRGTVEFRHKEGTVDYTEMTSWALICGHVVDAASRLSDNQIKALPSNSQQALLEVIPAGLHPYCASKWETLSSTIRCKQAADELWAAQLLQPGEEL